MGHAITHGIVDSRDQILDFAEDFAFYNTDREENPSGRYYGNLIIHDDYISESVEAAQDRIDRLDDGYGSDHAVMFYDYSHVEPVKATKKVSVLEDRLLVMEQKAMEYMEKTHVCVRTSQFIGCDSCGSKIARRWFEYEDGMFKSDSCPVCRFDLRSPTTKARLEKYIKDIKVLRKMIDNERKKLQTKVNTKVKPKIKWLVKVDVHN